MAVDIITVVNPMTSQMTAQFAKEPIRKNPVAGVAPRRYLSRVRIKTDRCAV
jgi:hypothetical protein